MTQLDSNEVSVTALTSDLPYTFDAQDIAANDTEAIHMKYTMDSDDTCSDDQIFAWQVEVLCDPANTDYADIISVDDETDPCKPYVTVSHASGCVEIEGSVVVNFCENNKIILSLLALGVGLVLGI
jgi:hypothetical protein